MHTPEYRSQWWQQARFGMFVHWGLYTIDGLDCWKMHDMGIPVSEYADDLEPRFTAERFDAQDLVQLAMTAGCKYVVMGTRHHEGYCLWDTRSTRFSSIKMTPKRDLIAEYVDAARRAHLGVGFYYSLLDWRFKSYWDGPRKNPHGWGRLVDYVHAQVRELMSQYGQIDILWYDGAWPPRTKPGWGFDPTRQEVSEAWRSDELNAMVRELQPDIIVNNRSYIPGDFGTPEQKITPEDRPWELCDTMGDLWGAAHQDLNRKTPREVLTRLITCTALGGNMLLNVGPDPRGAVQPWQRDIMARIGEWLRVHGEAIYGCTGEWAFGGGLAPWTVKRKGDTVYLHLLRYPGPSFGIANYHNLYLESATLIDTGRKLDIVHEPTRDILHGLPPGAPDDLVAVVRVETRPATECERDERAIIGVEDPE